MRKSGDEWHPIWIAHVPLRCGQTDDLSVCDEIPQFRTIRFRFDDRPQVVFQMLHAGETGLHETYAYRLVKGRLETTFSASLSRASVTVSVEPNGIERRLGVDTFLNRELPMRYRSFTLKTFFVFGENRFRIATDVPEEAWSADKAETELVYWGLVHQSSFAPEIEKLRERQKNAEAWSFDPVEVVRHRYADATKVRLAQRRRASPSCFSSGRTAATDTRCSTSRSANGRRPHFLGRRRDARAEGIPVRVRGGAAAEVVTAHRRRLVDVRDADAQPEPCAVGIPRQLRSAPKKRSVCEPMR